MKDDIETIPLNAPEITDLVYKFGAILGGEGKVHSTIELARQYKTALVKLIDATEKDVNGNAVLYPIMFLGRHSIELYLKSLVDFKHNHDIKTLMERYCDKYEKVKQEKVPDILTHFIDFFANLDPGSMAFRYADSVSKTIPENENRIRLKQLKIYFTVLTDNFFENMYKIITNENYVPNGE